MFVIWVSSNTKSWCMSQHCFKSSSRLWHSTKRQRERERACTTTKYHNSGDITVVNEGVRTGNKDIRLVHLDYFRLCWYIDLWLHTSFVHILLSLSRLKITAAVRRNEGAVKAQTAYSLCKQQLNSFLGRGRRTNEPYHDIDINLVKNNILAFMC